MSKHGTVVTKFLGYGFSEKDVGGRFTSTYESNRKASEKKISELAENTNLTSEEINDKINEEIDKFNDNNYYLNSFRINKGCKESDIVTGEDYYGIKDIVTEFFKTANSTIKTDYGIDIFITPSVKHIRTKKPSSPSDCSIEIKFLCNEDETQSELDARFNSQIGGVETLINNMLKTDPEELKKIISKYDNVIKNTGDDKLEFTKFITDWERHVDKFKILKQTIEKKLESFKYITFVTKITLLKCCVEKTRTFSRKLKNCDEKLIAAINQAIIDGKYKHVIVKKLFGKRKKSKKMSKKSKKMSKKSKKSKKRSKKRNRKSKVKY